MHLNGPALVLAIPGSGKTTVLIHRTKMLLNSGVKKERILSLTFSKAGALDMKKRASIFDIDIEFSTIHRFCYKVLINYFNKTNKYYTLIESTNNLKGEILRTIYYEIYKEYLTEDQLEEISSFISYTKNMLKFPREDEKLIEVYKKYEDYKKKQYLMDFDDMLTMCFGLFKNKPEILNYYQNMYDYIQIDECQDTSRIQHKIIYLLAKKHFNVYMVADDDQSIYGFRGAFPYAMLHIEEIYKDIKKYVLNINYRSKQNIVNLCKGVINKNTERHTKDFKAFDTSDGNLNLIYSETREDTINYLLSNADFEKNVILFRNNISLIPYADYLYENDIDFMVKDKKNPFFYNPVIIDILNFIKFSFIQNDIDIFSKIYFKMGAYISKSIFNHIKENNTGENIFDQIIYITDEDFKKINIRKIKDNFKTLSALKPYSAIDFIESDLNYRKYITEYAKKQNKSVDAYNNHIDILKCIAKNTDSLIDFISRIDKLKNIIEESSNNNSKTALKLYTIHSSKGLEFDHVYIVDVDDNSFPTKNAVDEFKEGNISLLEEERRLFYVAISRAKNDISIIHTRFKNGQYNKSSIFIDEYIKNAKDLNKINYNNVEKIEIDGFNIGDEILHLKFGLGTLVAIEKERIMIEFKDGTRTFIPDILNSKIVIKK